MHNILANSREDRCLHTAKNILGDHATLFLANIYNVLKLSAEEWNFEYKMCALKLISNIAISSTDLRDEIVATGVMEMLIEVRKIVDHSIIQKVCLTLLNPRILHRQLQPHLLKCHLTDKVMKTTRLGWNS